MALASDLRVQIVWRDPDGDRILDRLARGLAEYTGWGLGREPDAKADLNYAMVYVEAAERLQGWKRTPLAAYFSHYEWMTERKVAWWKQALELTAIQTVTAEQYGKMVPNPVKVTPMVEERFEIREGKRWAPTVGVSGFVDGSGRKGEHLVARLNMDLEPMGIRFAASGSGWPVEVVNRKLSGLVDFYAGLDVYLCASNVEGIPMPPLEALRCGVSVVVPWGVGMLDELPEMVGIYRYKAGDYAGMKAAVVRAVEGAGCVDRDGLREAASGYSWEAWGRSHVEGLVKRFNRDGQDGEKAQHEIRGINEIAEKRLLQDGQDGRRLEGLGDGQDYKEGNHEIHEIHEKKIKRDGQDKKQIGKVRGGKAGNVKNAKGARRGVYYVAYGGPARECAERAIVSFKKFFPEIPAALVSDEALGPEDVFIYRKDEDIGGRAAKVAIDHLAPVEWESICYLDADTEVIARETLLWETVEDGWDLVICKDPGRFHSATQMVRPDNGDECDYTFDLIGTNKVMQFNGGVFAYKRNERTRKFFETWEREWRRYGKRDQAALLRALFLAPVKLRVLGNEWNTVTRYDSAEMAAWLLHYPMTARRWRGVVYYRLDDPEAWKAVQEWEKNGRR